MLCFYLILYGLFNTISTEIKVNIEKIMSKPIEEKKVDASIVPEVEQKIPAASVSDENKKIEEVGVSSLESEAGQPAKIELSDKQVASIPKKKLTIQDLVITLVAIQTLQEPEQQQEGAIKIRAMLSTIPEEYHGLIHQILENADGLSPEQQGELAQLIEVLEKLDIEEELLNIEFKESEDVSTTSTKSSEEIKKEEPAPRSEGSQETAPIERDSTPLSESPQEIAKNIVLEAMARSIREQRSQREQDAIERRNEIRDERLEEHQEDLDYRDEQVRADTVQVMLQDDIIEYVTYQLEAERQKENYNQDEHVERLTKELSRLIRRFMHLDAVRRPEETADTKPPSDVY
jgi:hypothetical protein